MTVYTYNPSAPAVIQNDAWSCSCCTATWILHSLGIAKPESEVEAEMVAQGYVSPALGLLDGTGKGMAEYLSQYIEAPIRTEYPVSWDALLDLPVGSCPFGLGGQGWNHWSGARGMTGYQVALANPASNWMGVGDSMSEGEYESLGPFAAVWVVVEDTETVDDETQAYYDTALGTPENPGGLVGDALGTIEAFCNDASLDRDTLAAQVLGQCEGLRGALGI